MHVNKTQSFSFWENEKRQGTNLNTFEKTRFGRMDRRTDRRTDRQTLLKRCEDASKNDSSPANSKMESTWWKWHFLLPGSLSHLVALLLELSIIPWSCVFAYPHAPCFVWYVLLPLLIGLHVDLSRNKTPQSSKQLHSDLTKPNALDLPNFCLNRILSHPWELSWEVPRLSSFFLAITIASLFYFS